MEDEIPAALSTLLSLKSTSTQLSAALSRLNASLAAIALESAPVGGDGVPSIGSAFVASQESFLHNGVSARLSSSFRACSCYSSYRQSHCPLDRLRCKMPA